MSLHWSRWVAGLAAVLALSAPAVAQRQTAAPAPLAPFGVTEAAARRAVLAAANDGADAVAAFAKALERGYDRVAAASRASATIAALTWLKTYLASAAFAAEYQKVRAERKPEGTGDTASIDEAVRKQIADEIAEIEAGRTGAEFLPPKDRAGYNATIDGMIAERRKPEYVAMRKRAMEIERGAHAEDFAKASNQWTTRWPATPAAYTRAHLEHFLAATSNVDFDSPTFFVKDGTRTVGFLRPGLTDISWDHAHAILIGRGATSAARAMVESWLKELQ
jgi:hypothetical protein